MINWGNATVAGNSMLQANISDSNLFAQYLLKFPSWRIKAIQYWIIPHAVYQVNSPNTCSASSLAHFDMYGELAGDADLLVAPRFDNYQITSP